MFLLKVCTLHNSQTPITSITSKYHHIIVFIAMLPSIGAPITPFQWDIPPVSSSQVLPLGPPNQYVSNQTYAKSSKPVDPFSHYMSCTPIDKVTCENLLYLTKSPFGLSNQSGLPLSNLHLAFVQGFPTSFMWLSNMIRHP